MNLAELIHPLSVAEFVQNHFESAPLHVKGTPSRFADVFSQEAFFRAALHPRVGMIRCTFPDRDDKMVARLGRIPVVHVKGESVPDAIAAGATVFVDGLQRVDERIGGLCEALQKEIGFPCVMRAAAWLSPADSGVPFHNEGACTFLMQMEGTKIWRLSKKPAIQHPHTLSRYLKDGSIASDKAELADWEREIEPVRDDEIMECRVEPGDFLFIPSGAWHSTRASASGTTLSLNLYAEPLNPLDVLLEAVRPVLEKHADWRRIPPVGNGLGEGVPAALERYFSNRLGELAAAARELGPHVPSLERAWKRRLAESIAAPPRFSGSVERTDRLRLSAPVRYAIERVADRPIRVTLFSRGEEAVFDEESLIPFASNLLRDQTFLAGDAAAWAPDYAWEDLRPQLEALLASGFLDRVDESV